MQDWNVVFLCSFFLLSPSAHSCAAASVKRRDQIINLRVSKLHMSLSWNQLHLGVCSSQHALLLCGCDLVETPSETLSAETRCSTNHWDVNFSSPVGRGVNISGEEKQSSWQQDSLTAMTSCSSSGQRLPKSIQTLSLKHTAAGNSQRFQVLFQVSMPVYFLTTTFISNSTLLQGFYFLKHTYSAYFRSIFIHGALLE